jgi:hypothetical protein
MKPIELSTGKKMSGKVNRTIDRFYSLGSAEWLLIVSSMICTAYFVLETISYLGPDGTACPRELFCAQTKTQVIFALLSRTFAGLSYPSFFFIFASKLNYLRSILSKTWLSEVFLFGNAHSMHKTCGIVFFMSVVLHAIFHTIRIIALRQQYYAYFTNPSGWSGIVALLCCFLIVIPFWNQRIRKAVSFEIRKAVHYLFVVMLIVMTFHSSRSLYLKSLGNYCLCGRLHFESLNSYIQSRLCVLQSYRTTSLLKCRKKCLFLQLDNMFM